MKARRKFRKQRQSEVIQEQTPFFHAAHQPTQGAFFQAKLSVGAPGDKYEKQADKLASKVVRGEQVQNKDEGMLSKQEEEEAQTKLQRQEEEEAQAKLQRQPEEEEEELQTKVQKQEEEEEMQMKLQKQEEEEEMLTKLQKQAEEEEEPVQAKMIQRKEATVSTKVENRIEVQKGGGVPLPDDLREELEHSMNSTFKHVRIHYDINADQLCQELNALAFTVGNHIFFKSGRYQPFTKTGKELLAHELTHVMQQRNEI